MKAVFTKKAGLFVVFFFYYFGVIKKEKMHLLKQQPHSLNKKAKKHLKTGHLAAYCNYTIRTRNPKRGTK